MKTLFVGIGEIGISNNPEIQIKTMALGSCVGIMMYSPRRKLAALVHVALPESKINPQLAMEREGYFADTAIKNVLSKLTAYGCIPSELTIKIAGGANIMDPNQRFDIGTRNVMAVKKNLWHYKLGAIAEDIGGTVGRTAAIYVETGLVILSSPTIGEWEL